MIVSGVIYIPTLIINIIIWFTPKRYIVRLNSKLIFVIKFRWKKWLLVDGKKKLIFKNGKSEKVSSTKRRYNNSKYFFTGIFGANILKKDFEGGTIYYNGVASKRKARSKSKSVKVLDAVLNVFVGGGGNSGDTGLIQYEARYLGEYLNKIIIINDGRIQGMGTDRITAVFKNTGENKSDYIPNYILEKVV